MCGILGVYNQKLDVTINLEKFRHGLNFIKHRGPDAINEKIIGQKTVLGHTRLAIIDISSKADQPYSFDNLTLVYNGEVFNYIELRSELEEIGYNFNTASDTEVVIKAFHCWGSDCVKKFNGMWAFAIYNSLADTLFCSRDRFGIKPFNYAFIDDQFIFGSEIKSMLPCNENLRVPNYSSIANYLNETVGAQNPETWFEHIFRLPPATNLIVSGGDHQFTRYWDYPTNELEISKNEAKNEYLRLFEDSVKIRMRSDVPVGCTLSGGVDSTSIAKMMTQNTGKQINSYTASFPGETYNEFLVADNFAREVNLKMFEVNPDYNFFVKDLTSLIYHLESGHGSPAIYPLLAITKKAKEEITVYLEGQGADELLAGYINSTFVDFFLDCLTKLKFKTAYEELIEHVRVWPLHRSLLLYFRQTFGSRLRKIYSYATGTNKLLNVSKKNYSRFVPKEKTGFHSRLKKRLYQQHTNGLVNLLHYGDAISMMNSLENRLPFMDYRLVDFVFKLPSDFLIKHGFGKWIHREAMQGLIPDEINFNRKKLGFVSPIKSIFSNNNSDVFEIINSKELRERNIFNNNELEHIIDTHLKGKRDHTQLLFKILSIELWFRVFIDQKFG